MKKIIMALLLTSCGGSDVYVGPDAAPVLSELYVCHTQSTCAGVTAESDQMVCAATSSLDRDSPGDQAAQQWATLWKLDCEEAQGRTDTDGQPGSCKLNGKPALYRCAVECAAQYRACD